MSLTSADKKVIKRIKEGERKAYPEQILVDPSLMPGFLCTFLPAIFLLFSVIFPETGGPLPFDLALLGTLIGICILIPGIIVWLYFRNVYSYLGLKRFQIALSITALELSNLGHQNVQPVINPIFPSEYEFLTLFTSIGPSNLLKRMEGIQWDSETIAKMVRQQEKFTTSIMVFVSVLALGGGLIAFPAILVLSIISGTVNLFMLLLAILLVLFGVVMLLNSRRKLGILKDEKPETVDSENLSHLVELTSAKCSVEDVLSLIRLGYTHPIRLLVVETYRALEYTGRVYYTGDDIELREAYLLPASGIS